MKVLITGAAGGIGIATSRRLHAAGHTVVGADVDVARLDVESIAEALELDITDERSVMRTADAAGDVDALVNLVGAGFWAPIETMPMATVRRCFELNLLGPLAMMQAVLPGMRRRGGGVVINLSSSAAAAVTPVVGCYGAAKLALESVSHALAFEAAAAGIRVVVVQPGPVDTGFVDRRTVLVEQPDSYYRELVDRVVPRLLAGFDAAKQPADDVAQAIVDALSGSGPFRVPVPIHGTPDAAERRVADERQALAIANLLEP